MITRKLPVRLTEDDLLDRGKQLANAEHDFGVVDTERRDKAKEYREQLDAIDYRIQELSSAIRDKEELRDVECVYLDNHTNLRKELIRSDTGAVVESRAMTDEERQGTLI